MKKYVTLKRIAALSLAIVCSGVLFCMSGDVGAADASEFASNSTVKKYQQQIKDLTTKQKNIQKEISDIKNSEDSLYEKKEYYDTLIETFTNKLEIAQLLQVELEAQITTMNADIDAKNEQLQQTDEQIRQRLRVAYEEGEASYLEMILGAESLTDFLVGLDNVVSIFEYETRLMREYEDESKLLEDNVAQLETDKQSLADNIADMEASKAELDVLIKENASMIEDAMKELDARKKILRELEEEEEKASAKLDAFIDELIKQRGITQSVAEGQFMWPLPTKYVRITSSFGTRKDPFTGVKSTHGGMDIYAPYGTTIYASNNGTVVKSAKDSSYGNYILLDHGGGIYTLYAHASKLLVSEGTYVTKGTPIAQVGSTGRSTGNHLHFEVREQKTRVNPLGYVTKP